VVSSRGLVSRGVVAREELAEAAFPDARVNDAKRFFREDGVRPLGVRESLLGVA